MWCFYSVRAFGYFQTFEILLTFYYRYLSSSIGCGRRESMIIPKLELKLA